VNEIILYIFYEDVDECKTNTHTCDKNALCMNQWGGYKCRCNDGYEEHNSGRICSKKGEITASRLQTPNIFETVCASHSASTARS
jgi:hypothetical protein